MSRLYSVSVKMPVALLFVVIPFLPCHALADAAAAVKPETQANLNEAAHASPSSGPEVRYSASDDPGSVLSPLHQAMPHLEQALIILTGANGFVIVCGVILVFLKERLHSQTNHTLAALKATQRIAPNNASEIENKNGA
ncbi:MAG: hypothetical protein L0Z73_10090 [Gammaproteobacteria bacterium]|nr:hypothetical protein [Gammaproteobacteria bacterium]